MKTLIEIKCGDSSVGKFETNEGDQFYEIKFSTGGVTSSKIKSELTDLRDALNKLFDSQNR